MSALGKSNATQKFLIDDSTTFKDINKLNYLLNNDILFNDLLRVRLN